MLLQQQIIRDLIFIKFLFIKRKKNLHEIFERINENYLFLNTVF